MDSSQNSDLGMGAGYGAYVSGAGMGNNVNTVSAGDIYLASEKKKPSRKRLIIGLLLIVAAIGVAVLVFAIIRAATRTTVEEVQTAYWRYMNYLVRGEESTDALSDPEVFVMEPAIFVELDNNNEGYFEALGLLLDELANVYGRSGLEPADAVEFLIRIYDSVNGSKTTAGTLIWTSWEVRLNISGGGQS